MYKKLTRKNQITKSMKTHKKAPLIVILACITIFVAITGGCDKKDDDQDPSAELLFTDLYALDDSLLTADTTQIIAVASGSGLSYFWAAELGDIIGSGSEVTYFSPPCTPGNFEIICTVRDDANQEKTRSIIIAVTEF